MKSASALITIFVVPSGFGVKEHHGHIRGNLSHFDITSSPILYQVNRRSTSSSRQLTYHNRLRILKSATDQIEVPEEDLYHTPIGGDLSYKYQEEVETDQLGSHNLFHLDVKAKNSNAKEGKNKKKSSKNKTSSKTDKKPKSKASKQKSPKSNKSPKDPKKCSKKKPRCEKIPCYKSTPVCNGGKWVCSYTEKSCKAGFSCDATIGKCKAIPPTGCEATPPDCQEPLNKCSTNTSKCVNDTWICVESPVDCPDGFTCQEDNGECKQDSTASDCTEPQPYCLRPQETCTVNTTACVNKTWTPCELAPKICKAGYFCDEVDGDCKVDPNKTTTVQMDSTLKWNVNCSLVNDTLAIAKIIEQAVYECIHDQLQPSNITIENVYVQELCQDVVANHTAYSGPSSRRLEEGNMTDIELSIIAFKACTSCTRSDFVEARDALKNITDITGNSCLSATIQNMTNGTIDTTINPNVTSSISIVERVLEPRCQEPKPNCSAPDLCTTSIPTCLNNGTWICSEEAKCNEGYACDEADGVCKDLCETVEPPVCQNPTNLCTQNVSTCSDGVWSECAESPKQCEGAFACDEADGVCKDLCEIVEPPVCQNPINLCTQNVSTCSDGVWSECSLSPTPVVCLPGFECDPTRGCSGLFVAPRQVPAGEDVLLTFQIIPGNAVVGDVLLYFHETDQLIAEALDDGSTSTGDEQAGDGLFTNTFSFLFEEAGSVVFRADVGSNISYYGNVSVIDGGSVLESSVMDSVESRFTNYIANNTYQEALQQLHDDFISDLPPNVVEEDVVLTLGDYPSLAWTTVEGLTEALIPGFPSPNPPNWEPIVFGDTLPDPTPPNGRRKMPEQPGTDQDRIGQHNLGVKRKAQGGPFLECLEDLEGIEISFHGMQSSNFLWDVAKEAANVNIQYHISACEGGCSADPLKILKNLQKYDLVSVVAPTRVIEYNSEGTVTRTIALVTDVPLGFYPGYAADVAAERILSVNGYLAVTPAFFNHYTGSSFGGSVYIGGSQTIEFASSLSGFSAFFGLRSAWSPVDVWSSLFSGDEAGETPCVSDGTCNLIGDSEFKLIDLCVDLSIPKLIVTYTWPLSQRDLDTGTQFLGSQVGFACGGSAPYMTFSGDDTSSGGKEIVKVDLENSLNDGEWSRDDGVLIDLKAGWYSFAGGNGPASVSVELEDGSFSSGIKTIDPGSQGSCASTCVGSVYISAVSRLRAELTIGASACGVIPTPPPVPEEKTGPNMCQQSYYNTVDFSDSGPNEYQLAVAELAAYGTLVGSFTLFKLVEFHYEAFTVSENVYGLSTEDCQFNDCDAFRHSFFNYRITYWRTTDFLGGILNDGEAVDWAKQWADAHERTSINEFPVRMQDLINNDAGRRLAVEQPTESVTDVTGIIQQAIADGLMATEKVIACEAVCAVEEQPDCQNPTNLCMQNVSTCSDGVWSECVQSPKPCDDGLTCECRPFDVVVVGGGTGGAAAAIEAARNGYSVALLEETAWLGGQMSAAGVTGMDENYSNQKSGFYAEFLEAMRGYYSGPDSTETVIFPACGTSLHNYSMETCLWTYRNPNPPDVYCFEPSVAQCVLTEMVKDANIQIFYRTTITKVESRPFKDDHLNEDRTRVVGVNAVERMSNGSMKQHFFPAKFTIDATETGDVLELGPAEFRLANQRGTTESLEGQLETSCVQYITYVGVIKQYPNGFPSDDLLIKIAPPGYSEEVANSFRLLVANGTNGTDWKNDGAFNKYPMAWSTFLNYRGMPDSKGGSSDPGPNSDSITRTGLNLWKEFSQGNDVEIEADLSRQSRKNAACDGKLRTIQFLYYIQNELEKSDWSVADDEGYNITFDKPYDHCPDIPDDLALVESHLPAMPYVREGRRIVGLHDLTAKEIKRDAVCNTTFCNSLEIREFLVSSTNFQDALVVGDYAVDLHGCKGEDDLENEQLGETWADVPEGAEGHVRGPFQVPFGSFIPKDVDGLLVAEKNLAVSRLVNGAIREQPITMLTGQVAGAIAHLSLNHAIQPRYLSPLMVQRHMLSLGNKGRLALRTFIDVDRTSEYWSDVQLIATREIMGGSPNGNGDLQFLGYDNLSREEAAAAVCRTFGISEKKPQDNTFEDVLTDRWSFGCIEALAELGIVKGCLVPAPPSKPSFCPTEDITRAELATLLTLAYDPEATKSVLPPFYNYEDVNVPENAWAFNYTHLATKYGWMEACSPNKFCPKDPISRFDTAKIIVDPGKVLDDLEERNNEN